VHYSVEFNSAREEMPPSKKKRWKAATGQQPAARDKLDQQLLKASGKSDGVAAGRGMTIRCN
jgi:hypothetical protein